MCILTETTPVAVLTAVDIERKDALAQVLGAECEQIVIQHLATLKQKITLEPVLLQMLGLTGSPDRILVKKENCKLSHDSCSCGKRKHTSTLNETDTMLVNKRARHLS